MLIWAIFGLPGPTGGSGGPWVALGGFWGVWRIPSARAQFSVACSFVQDIGMWSVQTVATECPDHFMQLKLILNHPFGENVQKHHFGTLLRPNTPFYRSLGMPKWYENKQKCITSVEVTHIRIWKSWAPIECPKGLEVCQKVLYQ